jgi:hypothetical protein
MPRSYRSRRLAIKAIPPPDIGRGWVQTGEEATPKPSGGLMSEHPSPIPPEPGSAAGEAFPPEPGADPGEAFPPEPGSETGEAFPPEPDTATAEASEAFPPEPTEETGSPLPPE